MARKVGGWIAMLLLGGCGWSPSRPFERQAPNVKEAVVALDAGAPGAAGVLLEAYLETGSCDDGGVGIPKKVRERPFASFDLGIALFQLGERFGRRFGDEEKHGDGGLSPAEERLAELRNTEIECALRVVLAAALEPDVPLELRARAQYLAGNLEFLRRGYAEAVRHYDESLKIIPGIVDGGDSIGQDAAWNRAIALLRIEEENKRDAGNDAGNQPDGSAPRDAAQEKPSNPDGSRPNGDGGNHDQPDAGSRPPPSDAGSGSDSDNSPKPQPEEAGPPPEQPPPSVNQDQRMLDMLESAPTFQQEDAKNKRPARKFRGSADK
jgi:hypothetical protein